MHTQKTKHKVWLYIEKLREARLISRENMLQHGSIKAKGEANTKS